MSNKQAQFLRDKKYRENFERYRSFSKQKAEIEANMDSIKEEVATLLHEDKLNEKITELASGEEWKGAYQTTTRQSTDYKMLLEMIGVKNFEQIVTNKETTFLTIRKSGKKKINEKLKNKPVEDNNDLNIPNGIVLS